MFCKDCGAQLADDARFCTKCGCAQTITPPAEPSALPVEPDFADKVRATAKKVGSSTGFLIATICFTLAQLLNLLSLNSTGSILQAYNDIFAEFGMAGQELMATLEKTFLAIGIIGMIPTILIAASLWSIYGSCASRKNRVGTSGLTTIFVINLVQLVFSCLALLAAMLPLALLYAKVDSLPLYGAEEDMLEAILLAVMIVLFAIFVFALIYYIKVCTTVSNVRSTLKTGVPNKRASRFVAIMCYISGGILILSGISDLLSAGVATLDSYYDASMLYALPSDFFLSAVSALLTAAAQIIFGALIFSYRQKMKALEEEDRITTFQTLSHAEPYASPVYIPPEPAEVIAEPEVTTEPATEEEID